MIVGLPYFSTSLRISRSATRVASACACRSPMIMSGARVLEANMRTMSPRYLPPSQMRTGGMRRPSPKCSLALMSNEPGTVPPTSAQWPLDCA